MEGGTAFRASLVATIIIGNTNNAKVKLPANILLDSLVLQKFLVQVNHIQLMEHQEFDIFT